MTVSPLWAARASPERAGQWDRSGPDRGAASGIGAATFAAVTPPSLVLVGAGPTAALHGLAAQALGLPVRALSSRDPAQGRERAGQLGVVASEPDVPVAATDLVVVTSAVPWHAHDVEHALASGAGVLVEAPLCTTLAEADRLAQAVARSGAPLTFGENLAFSPIMEQALGHVRRIGALRHLEAHAVGGHPDTADVLDEASGGGALLHLGAHPLTVVLLAAAPAKVVEVRAWLQASADHPVDAAADVRLRFDDGSEAHVSASWLGAEPLWDFQAASDTGVVRAELLPTMSLERNGEPVPWPPARPGLELARLDDLGYIAQLDRAARDLATGGAPAFGVDLGREVLDVTCAAYRSAGRGGAPEPVPFQGERGRTPLSWWRDPT